MEQLQRPLESDEGEYIYAARLLISGGLPYEQSFLQKPPMIAYSYALAGLLAPNVFWFPRILAGVFAALATVLLGYAARREFGPGAAMPAMWLMTPMALLPELNQFIANADVHDPAVDGHGGVRSQPARPWRSGALAGGRHPRCNHDMLQITALPLLAFIFAV